MIIKLKERRKLSEDLIADVGPRKVDFNEIQDNVFLHKRLLLNSGQQRLQKSDQVHHGAEKTFPYPQPNKKSDFIQISVTSSVHQLTLMVDGEKVVDLVTTPGDIKQGVSDRTPWEQMTGLYIMVIHPNTGRLLMKKVLMTSEFGSSLELPSVLESVSSGRILIIAVKNDAALNLSKPSRELLAKIGVSAAEDLQFRQSLAWIGTTGGRVWAETTVSEKRVKGSDEWSSPVTVEVEIPKLSASCFDTNDLRASARASFCDLYDGYGHLCSCDDPAPISYNPPELEDDSIQDVPLIIIASNRPNYLYRCLVSVLRQSGGNLRRILVVIDGYYQEVRDLLHLFQVPFVEHQAVVINKSARISGHYKFSLNRSFSHFPKATKVILLEEDLLAAPDFFSFFNQTAWLLDVDPSLWCISAWNDLGSLHVARDPRILRRIETLPGLGWMVTKSIAEELLEKWPSTDEEIDWDIWARSQEIMNGRECVVPDVGRTFHFGISGSHSKGLLHVAFFAGHPVPRLPYTQLREVHRLKLQEYEEDIMTRLEDDPLYHNTSLHPCHPEFIPKNVTNGRPLVIFIEMTTFIDFVSWKIFARCLGLWDMDTRASHRGLFTFFFYDTEVFVIGYPFSDYSYLKPPWLKPLFVRDVNTIKKFDFKPPTNRLRFRRPQLEQMIPFWDIPSPRFPTFDETQFIS